MKTYSSSAVNADGQVVDIDFYDGIKFEVVPAFKYSDNSGYCYPDTNNGGTWKSMNPKAEIDSFNGRNIISNKWMSRDFFKYLLDNADQEYWLKPGSNERVYKKYSFKSDAEKAYNKCLEALSDYDNDYAYCWHQDWREIYGYKFPEQ